jgi:hypothetical protein
MQQIVKILKCALRSWLLYELYYTDEESQRAIETLQNFAKTTDKSTYLVKDNKEVVLVDLWSVGTTKALQFSVTLLIHMLTNGMYEF